MLRDRLILSVALAAIFAASLATGRWVPNRTPPTADPRNCRRIVSLAPSVTETLFALGLGDRVVGVTRYCSYPPAAAALARRASIGGYFDPNYETIVALQPDLVVMLDEHQANLPALERLGLPSLAICHKTIDGILDSMAVLGRACGVEDRAAVLVADLNRRMQRVEAKTAGLNRPRVMFVIDRTVGGGRIQDCCIAGAEGYFDRMIELAGGQNACHEALIRYPIVSREGIIGLDPDVIVDMSSGITASPSGEDHLSDWRQLPSVAAVRQGRVYALQSDFAFRPGPRFILLVEQLAKMIHREVDWETE